ncbi:hypothetical protein GOODEAATRI_021570, partial [Goodea atripinnis]
TELEKTVSLVCTLQSGTHDDKELVWLRNEAAVDLKDGNKENRSSVCISPVIIEDEGATFTCHLKSNASNKASVTLNVTYHTDISGLEEVTVEDGESLVLQCHMRANPMVTSVTWKLNGSIVDLLTSSFIITSDGITSKLQINKVERSLHEGLYQCTATSPVYGDRSKSFQLTVTGRTESSVMDGLGRAVVGVWRAHTALDESDGAESSPEVPDRFRKMRSSSSLGSLRMSLRNRLPLRTVQANSLPETSASEIQKEQPKPNVARKLSRSARNSISGMCQVNVWIRDCQSVLQCMFFNYAMKLNGFVLFPQRFQRTREFSREECLVATPGRDAEFAGASSSCTPRRTPRRAATPRRTPRSAAKPSRSPGSRERKTPEASVRRVKTARGRRQLVRMAALRSPFSSPNTENQRL